MEKTTVNTRKSADSGSSPVVPLRMRPTLRQVFEAEESSLLRFAYGLVGQRENAEDLVQEAFVKLHHHWDEVENARAWLFRCVRNLALNHIRKHKRETLLEDDDSLPSDRSGPEQELGRLEAVGSLQLLISEMPEEERRLISLKYHEGLKYDQISQRTGLSVSNVGYKLHHALKNLADSMRNLGIESAEG